MLSPVAAQRHAVQLLFQADESGVRIAGLDVWVDGVQVVTRLLPGQPAPTVMLDSGLHDFEISARVDVEGTVRPVGGAYRYRVSPRHRRLEVRLRSPNVWGGGGDAESGMWADPDVGCHEHSPSRESDCSSRFGGFRLSVSLQ